MRRVWIVLLLFLLNSNVKALDSYMHPAITLLDETGRNVIESGDPVSPSRSCGGCHDSDYIRTHSYHVCAGMRQMTPPGEIPEGRPWDTSPGLFGRWNPLTYRYLTPLGGTRLDLGTAEWVQTMGARHVGWGPSHYSRDLTPLPMKTAADSWDPETWVLDSQTGKPRPWDWSASGTPDMDCFLCHIRQPAMDERTAELQAGRFRWAATATLSATGLVRRNGEGWQWNRSAFEENGTVIPPAFQVRDPHSENCGQCHGLVHLSGDPVLVSCDLERDYNTETTGQVYSGQRIGASGLNLKGKLSLNRSWDIHAERAVDCIQCHHALNHPGLYKERSSTRPAHLDFDPRTLEMGNYLKRPNHNFAKGHVSQSPAAELVRGSLRRCEDCHEFESSHRWLPHSRRHNETLLCEACHVPWIYAPTRMETDWTVLTPEGGPSVGYRGVAGDACDPRALVTGYEPLLLPRKMADGSTKLAPQNLITSWFWVGGDPERPVRLYDLKRAFYNNEVYSGVVHNGEVRNGEAYHPDILAALDANGNGRIENAELVLNTSDKVAAIRSRLEHAGVQNPQIRGEIQPYGLHHDVASGKWALRHCEACHTDNSRISHPFDLAGRLPGGVIPQPVGDANVILNAAAIESLGGKIVYQPATRAAGIFLPGHDTVRWIDLLGFFLVLATLLGIAGHGGLRIIAAKRTGKDR